MAGSDEALRPGGTRALRTLRGRARAGVLLSALAIATTVVYVAVVVPAPGLWTGQLYWWPLVAGLMWATESAAVRVGIGDRLVPVPIVVVPTVIAFYLLAPGEVVLARLVGAALAITLLRQRSPLRSAITLVGVAASTSIGALAFGLAIGAGSQGIVGLLATSFLGAAAMVVTTAAIDALFGAVARPGIASGGLPPRLLVGLVTALLGTTFAVVAVVFLDRQPNDLWVLAAPAVVALLGFRSLTLQRRRAARLTYLYDCAQMLQGAVLDDATLERVLARTRSMFRVATVEVLVASAPGQGRYRRMTVDTREVIEAAEVNWDGARARLGRLGPAGAGRLLGGDELGPAGVIDERHGMVVAVHGASGVLGTLLVADRIDDLAPFGAEDLRVLQALGSRLGLLAENAGLAGQLAASAGHVRKLAAIVQSSEDAIAAIDAAGRVSAWNPAAARLFGYTEEEMIGRIASDVIPEAEQALVRATFAAAFAGAPASNLRMAWLRRDGSAIPISITVSPIRGDRDDVTGVSAIVRDETERLRAEAAVAAGAERLRTVIDGSPLGMGTAGPDRRWIQANPALSALLGVTGREIVGRSVAEMIHPDDRGTIDALEGRLFGGDPSVRSVERRYLGRGERVVWTQVTARLLPGSQPGDPVALFTVEDITERRVAQERTRITEERFRRAALAISSVQDPSRVIEALLESARDTLRAEHAAVATYTLDGTQAIEIQASGEDPEGLAAQLARMIEGRDVLTLAQRLGRPIRLRDLEPPDTASAPASDRSAVRSLLAVPLARDSPGTTTLYLVNKIDADEFNEGDEAIVVALATHAAVCLENARVSARARDLVLELDRANVKLFGASEAKNRFLAAVAHELRTPLHAILMAADLVSDPPVADLTTGQIRTFAHTVESSGRHMVRLIDDLSDLARIESGRMEIRLASVVLGDILAEVGLTLAAASRERGITLELPPGATPRIVADPVRLRQILTNLVGNAIKFTDHGGSVTVEAGQTRSATRITVRDTGIGIRAEDLERAFMPFEQVSRTSTAGAGLGLAISRSLAELHGGRLEATSVLGAGSAFTLTLPRRPRPSARHAAPHPP